MIVSIDAGYGSGMFYVYVCMYIYIYMYFFVWLCVYEYVCMYIYMHVCIEIYVYISIFIAVSGAWIAGTGQGYGSEPRGFIRVDRGQHGLNGAPKVLRHCHVNMSVHIHASI